jgi:hypothetical protein
MRCWSVQPAALASRGSENCSAVAPYSSEPLKQALDIHVRFYGLAIRNATAFDRQNSQGEPMFQTTQP